MQGPLESEIKPTEIILRDSLPWNFADHHPSRVERLYYQLAQLVVLSVLFIGPPPGGLKECGAGACGEESRDEECEGDLQMMNRAHGLC
jgi:hypothetical protein